MCCPRGVEQNLLILHHQNRYPKHALCSIGIMYCPFAANCNVCIPLFIKLVNTDSEGCKKIDGPFC